MAGLENITPYPVDENGIRIRLGRDPGLRMQVEGNTGGEANTGNTGGSETEQRPNAEQQGQTDDVETWKSRSRQWERQSKENASAAKERDEYKQRLEELEQQSKSDHEKALDKAVKEAEARARDEILTTANQRLVKASVRVAAAGKLADPEDAIRFLDLDEFKVDDDGEVDAKQLASAIDELLKTKPYLAAKATKPSGNIDQGARPNGGGKDDNVRGTSRMARAYANASNKS